MGPDPSVFEVMDNRVVVFLVSVQIFMYSV